MSIEIHKFEAAGLGKAPFRFVGVTAEGVENDYEGLTSWNN